MGKIFRKRGTKQNDILVFKAYFQVRVYTIVFFKKNMDLGVFIKFLTN